MRHVSMCIEHFSMRENSFECILPLHDKLFLQEWNEHFFRGKKRKAFLFCLLTIIGNFHIEAIKSEKRILRACVFLQIVFIFGEKVISENLHWQVLAKMLVPPHMIEEQSKIIYQINKYYVERVQTRMSIIDKTIREICQIVQDILRVSFV